MYALLSINNPKRNRRVSSHRSPLALVPLEVLLSPDVQGSSVDVGMSALASQPQRRPGPANPQWKIPRSAWPEVLRRVDQGETYRQIASHYGVSYEAVRLAVRAARRKE